MTILADAVYLLLALAGIGLQLLARRRTRLSPARAHLAVIMRSPAGRFTVLVLWWWVGWHFFVR